MGSGAGNGGEMDIFDIIGPIMIGPSSSHTAGAARIGRVARRLLGAPVEWASIGLYGSFASTYQGHGTDRAIVAGLMDMGVNDIRIRESLSLAREAGMRYSFYTIDELRDAHPNTAVILARGGGAQVEIQAASIGGGAIRVERLDGVRVSFTGENNTLVITHTDAPGVIAQVSSLLAGQGVNIATMQVFRTVAGGDAVMVIESDELPTGSTLECLRGLRTVNTVTMLKRLDR